MHFPVHLAGDPDAPLLPDRQKSRITRAEHHQGAATHPCRRARQMLSSAQKFGPVARPCVRVRTDYAVTRPYSFEVGGRTSRIERAVERNPGRTPQGPANKSRDSTLNTVPLVTEHRARTRPGARSRQSHPGPSTAAHTAAPPPEESPITTAGPASRWRASATISDPTPAAE